MEPQFIEMYVAGLVLDPMTNAPIVILKDNIADRCLPIWIGVAEATAIASALKNMALARPMTHDLLKNTIEELGGRVVRVLVNSLQENTFIAKIEIVVGDTYRALDSRPSDAIALALRVNAPICVAEEVLSQAQVNIVPAAPGEGEGEASVPAEATDQFQPEPEPQTNFANIEKDRWAEILADMDPDDFKYKM